MAAHETKAVFLSYAREDTDAAKRIADALRAFGVEVWFDQSELRGGDTWDAQIRQQIKDCTLFLAVISANTQSRREGYFRREWNLAVERTLDMAHSTPFLLPVVVDDTVESTAVVPEQFLRVQWTRLNKGVSSPQFVEQVQRLLSPADEATTGPAVNASRSGARRGGTNRTVGTVALIVALLAMAGWWFAKHSPFAASQPVVVLMDTPYADRVYDPTTLKNGGTNADDITDALRGLPISIVKESTSSHWNREAEVLKENPTLIVMHRSCFYTFPAEKAEELYPIMDNKLVAFLGYVATMNPQTHFILYSRHSWEDAVVAAKWREDAANRFPVLAGKIETWRVPLDRATFRNPITAQELRDSVVKQLGLKISEPRN